jgi:BirA family biotin operon repressor/biotin-[acetyl-CoA-carboxylase] ligase
LLHQDPIQSLFIGSKQLKLPSCHSTNAVAADLLAESATAEGTVIITDNQTSGKGQRGNTWESQPGKNLTLSIILKPRFLPLTRQFDLTVVSSLALTNTLVDIGMPAPQIKWPNDIYYKGSKIAGILIENSVRSNILEWSILGIGLNVNQSGFKTAGATSVKLELRDEVNLEWVLQNLLRRLSEYYAVLKSGRYRELRALYMERLMWLNEQRTFQNNALNTSFSGVIQRVSDQGKLIIAIDNHQEAFDFKTITFLH